MAVVHRVVDAQRPLVVRQVDGVVLGDRGRQRVARRRLRAVLRDDRPEGDDDEDDDRDLDPPRRGELPKTPRSAHYL